MHRQHVWHFEDTSEAKYAVKLGNNELYGTKKYIRYSREIAITLISTTNLSFGDQKSGYNFVRFRCNRDLYNQIWHDSIQIYAQYTSYVSLQETNRMWKSLWLAFRLPHGLTWGIFCLLRRGVVVATFLVGAWLNFAGFASPLFLVAWFRTVESTHFLPTWQNRVS